MAVFMKEYIVDSRENEISYINITSSVKEAIEASGIEKGICTVATAHTTCSVFFEEFTHDIDENGTEFLQCDLNRILESLVPIHDSADKYLYPGEAHYKEVESWPDLEKWLPGGDRSLLWNGDAHIKATIIGSSETFAVQNHKLAVGKTGYVYFVDFDRTRERKRKYKVIVIGE